MYVVTRLRVNIILRQWELLTWIYVLLYSCVDPRNISGLSRGKVVVDGRIIHIRLCNEQNPTGAGFFFPNKSVPRRSTVYLKLSDTQLQRL
jgi:hypothetical protein